MSETLWGLSHLLATEVWAPDHLSYRDIVAQGLASGTKVIHILGAPPLGVDIFAKGKAVGAARVRERGGQGSTQRAPVAGEVSIGTA